MIDDDYYWANIDGLNNMIDLKLDVMDYTNNWPVDTLRATIHMYYDMHRFESIIEDEIDALYDQ